MNERVTAYHEAGHIVAAIASGNEARSVTIIPDYEAGTAGLARTREWSDYPFLKWMILHAGSVAQRWIVDDDRGCGSDWDTTCKIICSTAEAEGWDTDDYALRAKVRGIEAAMTERINELRPQIEHVAAALLKAKTLTGEEVEALLAEFSLQPNSLETT